MHGGAAPKRRGHAKGGRHRCQPPCHRTSALGSQATAGLVSAACSTRAGKGIRASRRSPGPGVRAFRGVRFVSGPRRPASGTRPGPGHEALRNASREIHRPGSARAMPIPIHLPFGTILRLAFACARAAASAVLRPVLPLPAPPERCMELSEPAALRCPAKPPRRLRTALLPRSSVASHSRVIRLRFPEGTCIRMTRVSLWSCFGFPLPNRLLTVAMLSPIASRANPETTLQSC